MKTLISIVVLVLLFACEGPQARRAVKVKSGSFIKESVERNKALLNQEEALIKSIIQKDSTKQYEPTDFGAWYFYEVQVEEEADLPQENDLVTMNYNLLSLQNDTIYSSEEIGVINYLVDREELFAGLRQGVKLLKKGEKVTFMFPSHMAFGYHGDNDRIGPNIPIKSTVEIIDIEKSQDSILK